MLNIFQNCPRINTIFCLNPIPPTCYGVSTFVGSNSTFLGSNLRNSYDVYTYALLHVPMGSGEIYSSAYEWRYFNKIKEDMELNGKVYYANLTVKQGTSGYTRQPVKAAERYTIYIGSQDGYKVNSITFNGADVTDEMQDGFYTTPEIKGASVLSVSFEEKGTANIKSITPNKVRVTGNDGEIIIKNINEPSDVYVYATDGKLVASVSGAFGSATLQVPNNQLYVVKVGERTYKIALTLQCH